MQPTSHDFVARAQKGLADDSLQQALARFQTGFTVKRAEAAARLPEFEALRDQAVEIKNHTLEHLDFYLERFADKVEESGGEDPVFSLVVVVGKTVGCGAREDSLALGLGNGPGERWAHGLPTAPGGLKVW